MNNNPMLKLRNLTTHIYTEKGVIRACDEVSFDIEKGKNLGLVGESGCGKTMCCLSILRLLPEEAEIVSGKVEFEDKNLLKMRDRELREIRGGKISIIFQEPLTSLNPVLTVGQQITEAITAHKNLKVKEAKLQAIELLDKVKIDRPAERFNNYPHNLSGGMRQRVMIAMAISCRPKILIADEPTTALDVTIQAQILDLLDQLQDEMDLSILTVSHDFGVIARLSDRIAVMYAGQLVEYAEAGEIFNNPLHPYTQGLLLSIGQLKERGRRLTTIRGTVEKMYEASNKCRFYSRCRKASEECQRREPNFREVKPSHYLRCHKSHK
jgi:oligopeptide/dipeptide ABC transporter ATP-binding protein